MEYAHCCTWPRCSSADASKAAGHVCSKVAAPAAPGTPCLYSPPLDGPLPSPVFGLVPRHTPLRLAGTGDACGAGRSAVVRGPGRSCGVGASIGYTGCALMTRSERGCCLQRGALGRRAGGALPKWGVSFCTVHYGQFSPCV